MIVVVVATVVATVVAYRQDNRVAQGDFSTRLTQEQCKYPFR